MVGVVRVQYTWRGVAAANASSSFTDLPSSLFTVSRGSAQTGLGVRRKDNRADTAKQPPTSRTTRRGCGTAISGVGVPPEKTLALAYRT